MATAASTSTPSSPLPTTASTLWAQLLNHRGPSKANATQPHSYAQLTPQDKAGTSTRILLHDTHARLEQFSERANSVLSAIETSKREMVRVREEVENAREKELDAIAQLINRCQSSLQKTIGAPMQEREAAMMQGSLTVTTERLHAFEEKINSKFDALTALLQTQNQRSQSLQEQFSRVQAQQCQILELLAPLHPLLESVPLHISIARNAILEKIPKGCQCRCIDYCPGSSIPSAMPSCGGTPLENSEPLVEGRKRRRISLDTPHPDSNSPPARGDREQSILDEVRRTPDSAQAQKPRETPTLAQPQRDGTHFAVQTPIGGKSGNEPVSRGHLGGAQPQSGSALLATRRSIISRGTASRVPTAAVPGKRFILFNDDDDDDEEL